MTPDQKRTYTIQEAAEEMQVSPHTLRYYEKIGLLHPISRNASGRRYYEEEDLGWIYWLKLLRDSGLSIRVIKRYVELTRMGDHTMGERCAILEEHRERLRSNISRLKGCLAKINSKVEFYRGYEMKPKKKR